MDASLCVGTAMSKFAPYIHIVSATEDFISSYDLWKPKTHLQKYGRYIVVTLRENIHSSRSDDTHDYSYSI